MSSYDALVNSVLQQYRTPGQLRVERSRAPKFNRAQLASINALKRRMAAEVRSRKKAVGRKKAGAGGKKKSGWAAWKAKGGGRGRRKGKKR